MKAHAALSVAKTIISGGGNNRSVSLSGIRPAKAYQYREEKRNRYTKSLPAGKA